MPQVLGEHLLAHAVEQPPDLAESLRPGVEHPHQVQLPFTADDVDGQAHAAYIVICVTTHLRRTLLTVFRTSR